MAKTTSKLLAVLLALVMVMACVPIMAAATYPSDSGAGFTFQFGDPNTTLEELSPEKDMVFSGTAPTFTANYSGDLNGHDVTDQTTYYPSILAFYVTSGVQNIASITATGLTYIMYDADDTTHTQIPSVSDIPSTTTKLGFALTLDEASTTTERKLEIANSSTNLTLTIEFNQPHIYLNPTTATKPTALKGYLPVGQFATGAGWGSPFTNSNATAGINAASTVTRKVVSGYVSTGMSLGAPGGYAEYDFSLNKYQTDENNVTTRINRPYGVDFVVYGNAFINNPEAGSVMVYGKTSSGAKGWFELAGSLYYSDLTLRNVTVTYKKVETASGVFTSAGIWYRIDDANSTQITGWTKFNTNTSVAWWPEDTEGYYDYNNIPGVYGAVDGIVYDQTNNTITYPHVTIVKDTDTTSDYAFGYFDITPNGSSYGTAVNPYVYGTTGGNGYSLDWAVDGSGNPVDLSSIEKVRVYTSAGMKTDGTKLFTVPSIFGETSAELCGIFATSGTATDNQTSAPTIKINNQTIAYWKLQHKITQGAVGNIVYYDATGMNLTNSSATITATPATGTTANIYINDSATGSYSKTSTVTMVRVIAQTGDGAPYIAVIKF